MWLAAWLLLLLRDGDSYGRALVGGLSEHAISVDAALVYRTLRELDADGAVTSRWAESDAGPRRRSYRLTRKGRRRLAEHATNIAATRQLHDAFIRAYQDAAADQQTEAGDERLPSVGDEHAGAGRDDRGDAPSQHAGAASVSRELLTAWLLLLLTRGDSYGYDLRRVLDEQHLHADPGALYRLLRTLEADGCLQSRWMSSVEGPQRRLYRLTTAGRRRLGQLAEIITASRDSLDAFLQAYQHAPAKPRRRRRDDPAA